MSGGRRTTRSRGRGIWRRRIDLGAPVRSFAETRMEGGGAAPPAIAARSTTLPRGATEGRAREGHPGRERRATRAGHCRRRRQHSSLGSTPRKSAAVTISRARAGIPPGDTTTTQLTRRAESRFASFFTSRRARCAASRRFPPPARASPAPRARRPSVARGAALLAPAPPRGFGRCWILPILRPGRCGAPDPPTPRTRGRGAS